MMKAMNSQGNDEGNTTIKHKQGPQRSETSKGTHKHRFHETRHAIHSSALRSKIRFHSLGLLSLDRKLREQCNMITRKMEIGESRHPS